VKGSFLRRSGSFGGRSKITQTFTSRFFIAQQMCRNLQTAFSTDISPTGATVSRWKGRIDEIEFLMRLSTELDRSQKCCDRSE